MLETWYILEDGSAADPNEVAPDETGALLHKSGARVAVGPHGPRSRSVDPDAERAKGKAKPEKKEMVADDQKPGYRNREMKAK